MDKMDVVRVISGAVARAIEMKGEPARTVEAGTVIFGTDAALDSLDLVNVIVQVEEAVKETLGKEITVVDEASLIATNSPFRTVGSLAELVQERIRAG
jgi:acyl carrier protein